MLDVRDLRVRYGAMEALRGVSFEVRQGEAVAIIGANGSGKSTTLRALMGLVPSTGRVTLDGRALDTLTPYENQCVREVRPWPPLWHPHRSRSKSARRHPCLKRRPP